MIALAVIATWAVLAAGGATAANAQSAKQSAPGLALLEAPAAPVTGTAEDGTAFVGSFKLKRFVERGGTVYAVGRLTGQLGTDFVRKTVRLPITGASNPTPAPTPADGPSAQQVPPTPGACEVLDLVLGPLDLNLLGLRVALDQVSLLIEAIPGAGMLLGNLLCAVAGLLDGGVGGGLGGLLSGLLGSLTELLNGLLGILPSSA